MNLIHTGNNVNYNTEESIYNQNILNNIQLDFPHEADITFKAKIAKKGPTLFEMCSITDLLPEQKRDEVREFINWDIESLIDYISYIHFQFIRKRAVIIYEMAEKVADRHSSTHPELNDFVSILYFFTNHLLNHITKEEQILFPNIKLLLKNNNKSEKRKYTTFGLIKEWVRRMKEEHQSSYKYLNLLKELTNNYMIPPDSSHYYQSLFRQMQEFDAGSILLMQIENDILFPKVLIEDSESD